MAEGIQNRFYGTGKRKNAVARVWIAPGTGVVTINDRPGEKYLGRAVLLSFPLMTALATCHAAGEVAGYIAGAGKSPMRLS